MMRSTPSHHKPGAADVVILFSIILQNGTPTSAGAGLSPLQRSGRNLRGSTTRVGFWCCLRCVARVSSNEGRGGAGGQAVGLAQLLVSCMGLAAEQRERGIIESALEYFDALSVLPMAARAPELRQPLSISLLQAICRSSCYPPDFTGWATSLDDPDDFTSFRCVLLIPSLP